MRNNWRIVKIPEVLFFQEGPGVRKNQFSTCGVKLLNVGNINEGEINLSKTKVYISEKEAFGKYKHFLIDEGDLVIASSGIIVDNFYNKIAFIKKEYLPLCMNTSTIRFKSLDSNIIDLNYFKFFLKTKFFSNQLQKLITGSAQLNFGPSHLKKIDLILPPLEDQKRIVKILDVADALRQKRKQAITLLDDYLKSVFLEMFGDPIKNPKGWTIKKLGKICDVKGGKRIPKGFSLVKEDTGYPYIKAGNIKQGKILLKDLEYLTCELREKLKRYTVEKGDVCITVVGANIGDIGIVPNSLHMANLTENANKLLIKNKKELNNNYLTYYLMMDFIQNELVSSIRASGVPKLALFRIQQIDLLLPPISLQMKFSQILEQTESIKQKMLTQAEELETQFQALMQKAFKGEL